MGIDGPAGTMARAASRGPQPGLPVAHGQETTLRRGRNWYGGRHLGRLGAQTGNVRQGVASMNTTREDRPRRRPLVRFIGLPLGLLFLANGFNRPTIANMRSVDLVYLLGTGACLGAGMVAVVMHFVFRREG